MGSNWWEATLVYTGWSRRSLSWWYWGWTLKNEKPENSNWTEGWGTLLLWEMKKNLHASSRFGDKVRCKRLLVGATLISSPPCFVPIPYPDPGSRLPDTSEAPGFNTEWWLGTGNGTRHLLQGVKINSGMLLCCLLRRPSFYPRNSQKTSARVYRMIWPWQPPNLISLTFSVILFQEIRIASMSGAGSSVHLWLSPPSPISPCLAACSCPGPGPAARPADHQLHGHHPAQADCYNHVASVRPDHTWEAAG